MMDGKESGRESSGSPLAKEASLDRLVEVLDAYGASPARWPEQERHALEALLAASPEARELQASAGRLDAALDAASLEAPSRDLVERILATAPHTAESEATAAAASSGAQSASGHAAERAPTATRTASLAHRPRARRPSLSAWRGTALAALAAAAAFALWITRDVTPDLTVVAREQTASDRDTELAALDAAAIAELGVFSMPSDTLLESPGLDLAEAVPALGCEEGDLGCPEFSSGDLADPTSESRRTQLRRAQA